MKPDIQVINVLNNTGKFEPRHPVSAASITITLTDDLAVAPTNSDAVSVKDRQNCSFASEPLDRAGLVSNQAEALTRPRSHSPLPRPPQIDDSDLGDHGDRIGPPNPAAVDAIYGQGLPETAEETLKVSIAPDPTLISDLGDNLARATFRIAGSHHLAHSTFESHTDDTNASERASSSLHQALLEGQVRCPDGRSPHETFIPRGLIDRIMTQNAVKEELKRSSTLKHWQQLQSLLPRNHASSDLTVQASRILGSGRTERDSWRWVDKRTSTAITGRTDVQPKSFRRVLAILVLMDKTKKIQRFLDEDIGDEDLPLEICPVPHTVGPSKFPARWELRSIRAKDHTKTLRCFRRWKPRVMEEFVKHQWTVLAPFFALGLARSIGISGGFRNLRKIHHWDLPNRVVLPFRSFTKAGPPGGCGQVYKVEIHPDHHAFTTGSASKNPNVFAVKELLSGREDDFKREVRMLRRLNSADPHPHLTNLLATYQYRGLFHLVFPWAERDLVGFWEEEKPNPIADASTAWWLATQCKGLAEALATIHRYPTNSGDSLLLPQDEDPRPSNGDPSSTTINRDSLINLLHGRHGDIKPANILWFPDDKFGVLKFTDFSIAEFTPATSMSSTSRKMTLGNTRPYCAPEALMKNPSNIHSRNDIWSLGCVFLECVTWYLGGNEAVKSFEQARSTLDEEYCRFMIPSFYARRKDGSNEVLVVKPEVMQYIEKLHGLAPSHISFVTKFLILIQNHMLLASLDSNRMSALNVARELGEMLDKEEYWSDRSPISLTRLKE